MNKQKGFTVAEVAVALVVIGALIFGGYTVWHRNKTTKSEIKTTAIKTSSGTSSTSKNEAKPTVAMKTYTNSEFGFSFQYPETWSLTTKLSDLGRGGNEGDVYVTSPNGTKVHFGPDFGGKGGDCVDTNGERTIKTCTKLTIYSVETISEPSASKTVQYYEFSIRNSSDQGGDTKYYVDIWGGRDAKLEVGSTIAAYIYPWDEIYLGKGYVTVYVDGSDASVHNSKTYFVSTEATEAGPILKSFKIL